MKKRGVFFSIDALIAIIIIIAVILIAYPSLKESKQETEIHSDILISLSTLKVGEINNTYVKNLVLSGEINNTNKSILEQIGEFYVTDINKANALAEAVLSELNITQNIGIWYGNTLIWSRNSTPYENAKNVETIRQIISGIQEGSNITGFSARSFLASSQQTIYTYFGGYVGDGNITTRIEYYGNITSAIIEIAISNNFTLYINGVSSGNFNQSADEFTPRTYTIPLQNFKSGINLIDIKGKALHIAGGFTKITYQQNASVLQPTRSYFPGIYGLINLYDSLFIPGNLNSMDISLHMNTSFEAFVIIGNITVFRNVTQGEQTITIPNSQLSSQLNYNYLSKKTIPVRIGLENFTYSSLADNKTAEVLSVTDLSGSMGGAKITEAKTSNKILIDAILNLSGNRVSLVGYESFAKKADFHNLTNNKTPLNNLVDNTWNAAGATCICCGILKAISCYDKSIFKDNFNGQTSGSNPAGWTRSEGSGTSIDITTYSLEGDRALSISRTGNNNPIAYHRLAPQQNNLSIEFLVNHTIGPGNFRLEVEGADDSSGTTYSDYIIIKMDGTQIKNNNAALVGYAPNKTIKIKLQLNPGSGTYNLYVNDTLSFTNLPVYATRSNVARLSFTTENTTANANTRYIIDDIKLYLNQDLCSNTTTENKTRTAVVMSDGWANIGCGLDPVPNHDGDGSTTNDPQDHAIEAACSAYNNYNITIHAVGFGTGADQTTLTKIAQCGHGNYYFGDVNELANIYQQIAEGIISATYREQTLQSTQNVTTILYPDSYINLNYQQESLPYGLIITTEKKFDNETSAQFSIPLNSTILEAKATSYSGSKWTNTLRINNTLAYDLSAYGSDYIKLGDPFVLDIPKELISINNSIILTTGLSPTNTSVGSKDNKVITKIVKNITAYSKISANTNGCTWTIQFEDNTNITIPVPSQYLGAEICRYTETSIIYNDNDATQNAVFKLLQLLDLNNNNKVDVKFDQQDLKIDLSEIVGIPYTWSTEVQARIWY